MNLSTEGLARASSRRPWRTVLFWVVLIAAAIGANVTLLPSALTNEFGFSSNPDSVRADDMLEARLRGPKQVSEMVIVQSPTLKVDDPAFKDKVEELHTLPQVAQIVRKPMTNHPWNTGTAPIEIRVPGRRVRGWKVEKHKIIDGEWINEEVFALSKRMTGDGRMRGNFAFTPQLPDVETLPGHLGKRAETVTLIPYGCTTLRISVFPQASAFGDTLPA